MNRQILGGFGDVPFVVLERVEELSALVKEAKGSHYAPKSVDFVDAIPLTAVGKPDKKVLRQRYWSESGRQVG